MGIKLFLNDYYDLLKFMHDNEVVILDEKVIPLGDGFLGGEAYLQNGNEEIYLNSETDSSAITVKEAKEILESRQVESDDQ